MTALADEPVHVVATLPAGVPGDLTPTPEVTLREFVPHGVVLDRAVCAVTHGGKGATQKALARGVSVCVVPFGRDQFEVARRVEVARKWHPATGQETHRRAVENESARSDDVVGRRKKGCSWFPGNGWCGARRRSHRATRAQGKGD
jgi:EryCIII-like glycosyltransferase